MGGHESHRRNAQAQTDLGARTCARARPGRHRQGRTARCRGAPFGVSEGKAAPRCAAYSLTPARWSRLCAPATSTTQALRSSSARPGNNSSDKTYAIREWRIAKLGSFRRHTPNFGGVRPRICSSCASAGLGGLTPNFWAYRVRLPPRLRTRYSAAGSRIRSSLGMPSFS